MGKYVNVWGHRGASGYAPENTMASYKLAAKMGADGIELDVQLTRDGSVVVCHDERIDRTSDHQGFVKDYTLEELRAMDFGQLHPECDAPAEDKRIPLLEEVLKYVHDETDMVINIELKTGVFFYPGIEKATVHMVHQYDMQDRVIYSSFNHYSVRKIQKLDVRAKVGLLYEDGFIDVPQYGHLMGVDALHPSGYCLQYPHYMEDCARYGLDVNVWTVNRPEDMVLCMEGGVTSVITNYPDKAIGVRKELGLDRI